MVFGDKAGDDEIGRLRDWEIGAQEIDLQSPNLSVSNLPTPLSATQARACDSPIVRVAG